MVSDFRPHESYQFFLQEVPELLQTLEEGLLDLASDYSVAKIYRLMRAAHSLKGGAACVGLDQIQTLAHQLETVLKACSDRAVTIDLELENLILQAFDCLKMPLLEELQTGCSDDIALTALYSPVWLTLEAKLQACSSRPIVPEDQLAVERIAVQENLSPDPIDPQPAELFRPDRKSVV